MYPLKFDPLFMELIWGGNRLATLLKRDVDPQKKIGESWEISDVPGKETRISNGIYKGETLQSIIRKYPLDVLGKMVKSTSDGRFPLLIKYIDAAENLSIQVHPNDEVAKLRHKSMGKNEMWYILKRTDGAQLISGFEKQLNKEEFIRQAENGTLENSLHKISVDVGDVFYIPAGKVHAIGKGILVAEIQQTSDITYRIFDYNRVDSHGNKRQLHLQESVDVVNFDDLSGDPIRIESEENKQKNLVTSPFFITNIVEVNGKMDFAYIEKESFHLYILLSGCLEINSGEDVVQISNNETVLLPASITHYSFVGKGKLLEVYM